MANHSRVPHRGIPAEEFIVKDGKTYYPFSGPLNHIDEDVQYHKHKKWGFLIYRCDYSSDEAWAKFLSNLNWEVENQLKIFKAEHLWDTMEMTPKEDKKVLDGATVDQVRNIFTEWVRSDEARAEINDGPCGAFTYPRHTFCVHVDADVLDSVVNRAPQPPTWDRRHIAYANLVQLRHEDFAEELGIPVQDFTNNDEEDEEEDDASEYGDLNFVKVPLSYLGPESYNELYSWSNFEHTPMVLKMSETYSSNPQTVPLECSVVTTTAPENNADTMGCNTTWMSSPPAIDNACAPRLEKPVVIPRMDISGRLSAPLPFMRAYSPELRPHGINEGDFVGFIDNLAVAQAPPAPLQILNVAGTAVGFVPHHWATFAGAGMNVAAGVGTAAVSYGRTRYFLEKANREYFAPRRLYVSICKYQELVEKLPISSHAAVLCEKDLEAGINSIRERCMSALQPYIASLSFDVPHPSGEHNILDRIAVKGIERKRRKQERKSREDGYSSDSSSSSSSGSSSDETKAKRKAARRVRKIESKAKKDTRKHPTRAAEIEEDRAQKLDKVRGELVRKADKGTKRLSKRSKKDLEKVKRLEFIVVEALGEQQVTT
ncbi:hypothetical protein yc1106_01927 [Curvularia clavata]|uniref:Uncharacterized protein n=1 Tax=Curvularia clavata TaxID=95742 RepID=A0A9Q8Z5F6_CURCL|nr:hypothetical protein yc1106_01927 [Curvularia clavata]